MAKRATWHYLLPGLRPEVVLLQSPDGYVTAEYDPKARVLWANYHWHEWKERRRLIFTDTGSLPAMQSLPASDQQILSPSDAEVKHAEP